MDWLNSTDVLLKTMQASWNLLSGLQEKEKLLIGLPSAKNAYQYIKTRYQNAPIFIGVDWKLEFQVHTDASDIEVGAMLAQNPTSKTD